MFFRTLFDVAGFGYKRSEQHLADKNLSAILQQPKYVVTELNIFAAYHHYIIERL